MSESYNIIGDIAGNHKTLMALIEKMPKGKTISVGDIVDRGPRSKEVIEYFRENKETTEVLMGNHEHMLVDYWLGTQKYQYGIYLMNGGTATLESFGGHIPGNILKWLEQRPVDKTIKIKDKTYYISHAFKPLDLPMATDEENLKRKIWNRNRPIFNSKSPDYQICGHNSQMGLKYFDNGNVDIYGEKEKKAICIDTSASNILTGIHIPSMLIFQQEYID